MLDDSDLAQSGHRRVLAERALRAIATAHTRRAEYESAFAHLQAARERADELRVTHAALWQELQRTIAYMAQGERFAGRPPEHMLVALKELVDRSGLDRDLMREIEPDVLRWGIDAYYAA
jgi:ATP/maltotriose-dependent transcriptional regulator MalT